MKLFAGQFATKLMLFATYALALTAAVAVLLEIVLVWNVDGHGMVFELTEQERQGDEPPLDPALESLPQLELNVSDPALSQQEAENVFLELVKRRMSIKTPLDTSFYRPFARANKDAKNRVQNVKTKITVLVSEGQDFPALKEIKANMETTDPASSAVFKEYARATAKAKVAEVQGLLGKLESACTNMKAVTLSLGDEHNTQALLTAATTDIDGSYAQYRAACTIAIKSLAPYTSVVPTSTSTTPASTSRSENKFSKISHTAEPCALPS